MNTNLKPKLQRFASATAFACPICQENLTLLETNFKCCNRHSFDLAKFGYVNLAPQIKQSANYGEFRRVLSKDGILIKVIPTENHLKEIRQRVQDQLTNKEYSNQDIKEHFQEHFTILSSQTASLTKTITAEQLQALLSMTPLLFHVDQSKIDWSQLTEITIEAEILVGKAF
ncbi:putative RNA methyltransferase [Streptococcus pneumoniae]|uniref:putative RNA methyltransferase n=1 Tax=Streptococcus pneumoniae TaxID=1313 RepID=UPI0005DDF689|nr:hypothetical protein [Streptococcus pneumoniae]COF99381.1 23S_rRNA m1G745 methyltransferase [Streptococcus pneumoniae]COL98504.1 23S_rRNA m1G745 methyltransferase [Streptococcus pneumoniae]HEU6103414.1 hypothetical protein [Streptococcus pneumoniae]HEW2746874.1 hypothetical protein [Streptococcus pneumoniae]